MRALKQLPEGRITEFLLQTYIFASIINLTLVCFVSSISLKHRRVFLDKIMNRNQLTKI